MSDHLNGVLSTTTGTQEPYSTPSIRPARPRLKLPGFVSETIRTIVFVLVVTVLFDMAIPRSLVEGSSMEPNFHDGDRLIVSRVSYLFGEPEYGEVMVFNSMRDWEYERGVMLIKRIIGLPGDTVELRDQQLYVNGELRDESYIAEACSTRKCPDEVWQLGPDEFFAMGDNRNHSNDSRDFGPVTRDHIVGRVLLRYWPLNGLGVIAPSEIGG